MGLGTSRKNALRHQFLANFEHIHNCWLKLPPGTPPMIKMTPNMEQFGLD